MSEVFDLEGLPDDEFSHVLSFLNVKEKKRLRQVSARLAEKVMRLTLELRSWRIELNGNEPGHAMMIAQVFKALQRAREKGISNLPGFKFHLHVTNSNNRPYLFKATEDLCRAWQPAIFGLSIISSCDTPESLLSSLHLSNLEELQLVVSPKNATVASEMVKRHVGTLKKVDIWFYGTVSQTEFDIKNVIAPRLEVLQVHNLSQDLIQPTLTFGAPTVTKLVLLCGGKNPLDLNSISIEVLKLPQLKELVLHTDITGCDLLIKSNAEKLETLCLHGSKMLNMDGTVLPNLTTYIHNNGFKNIFEVIDSSSETLQKLVLYNSTRLSYHVLYNLVITLPKLTEFVAPFSKWSVKMVELSAQSLKSVVLGLDVSRHVYFDNLEPINLPSLDKFIVIGRLPPAVLRQRSDVLQLLASIPEVQVKQGNFVEYIRNSMMKKGL